MQELNRRSFIQRLGAGAAASTVFSPLSSLASSRPKPNIVYILADDLGYGDISCLNEKSKLNTTHIDSIARQGIAFTDAHSGSAVCTPTRYGILTGRYCWRSRLKQGVLNGYSNHLIEDGRTTVASFLKKHDYHTGCIGKWHLGFDWKKKDGKTDEFDFTKPIEHGPTSNGFDYFFGISASLDMPPYVYIENDRVTAQPNRNTKNEDEKQFWREGPTGADFKHEEVLPTLTSKAVRFIQDSAKEPTKPFFLYLPLPAPHTPILPTKEFLGKSKTNAYGDFVLQVDWTVGQVLKALEETGAASDTLVIFTSDNGCSPRADYQELAQFDHNPSYHFRGHKADIFEGGHRIPFVARWPGKINAGSQTNETICLTDILATSAAIVGDALPKNSGEDSYNILPALLGKQGDKPIREATVHHSINGSFSIRQGRWKLELCPGSGGWSDPRPDKAKKLGLPSVQLYNLETDIAEKNNVWDKHPDIVKRLTALLDMYKAEGRSAPRMK